MLFERLVSFSRFIAVKIPEATTADISEGPRSRKRLLPPTADVQITRRDTGMGDADRVRARMMQMRSVVSLLNERSLKAGARIAIPLDLRMPTGLFPAILP